MAITSISPSFPALPTAKPAAVRQTSPASPVQEGQALERSDAPQAVSAAAESAAATAALPDRAQIDQAMERMQQSLPTVARNLQFSLDEETGRTVVTVVDASTNEVIRQIPSEELLTIARTLDKFTGLLLKQKA